jgi:hypothetical protein
MKTNYNQSLSVLTILIFSIIAFGSCNLNDSDSSKSSIKSSYSNTSVDGTYKYSDSGGSSVVTVSGNRWSGKTVINSGFGSSYDNGQAQYSNGVVKNGKLYDSSGYVQLGTVDDYSLEIAIGSNMATHYK